MPPDDSVDADLVEVLDAVLRLTGAGWSVSHSVSVSPDRRLWTVTARNGEQEIRAEGRTAVEV
jgi:hypothetical protein